MRVIKKLCALTLCFLIVFQVASVSAEATETTKITVENTTTYVGSEFYVDVLAENLKSLASLDLTLFYDKDVLTLQRVDTKSLLDGAASSVNTDVLGQVSLSMATTTAISGSGYILTLIFNVKPEITAQTTNIEIAIGDAYNSSFSPISISGGAGNVEILEVTEISDAFYLHSCASKTDLALNDITKVTIFNSNFYNFASADFTFIYDPVYFELVSVTLSGALLEEGAIHSCNTDVNGLIKISYASTNEVYTSELFTVELKMIKDVEFSSSTEVLYSCKNVATSTLSVYQPHQSGIGFNVLGTDGSFYLESTDFIKDLTAESVVKVSADSNVAAGDFVIRYDITHLRPISVTVNINATLEGGMVFINPNFQNGEIKFSYVNENGLTKAVSLLDIVWEVLGSSAHTIITPFSTSLVDVDYNDLTLQYIESSECLYSCSQEVINSTVHPHHIVYECEICQNISPTSVSGVVPDCVQCEQNYLTTNENSEIDYALNLVFTDDKLYKDIESIVSVASSARITTIPSDTYNDVCYYGTGSKITVYDEGILLGEYTVIVKGDLNGDSVCDALDCMLAELARTKNFTPTQVQIYAANGTVSNSINENSFQFVVNEALD